MTSDKGKAFWLGIFVIVAICTVAWLFLFLKPTVGDGKTTLKIRFTNIEGVTIGTRVNFGGKPVGVVIAIKELHDARSTKPNAHGAFYFFEVIAKVDSRVKVYNYDRIILTTQGLLGEKSIEIVPLAAPKGAKPAHLITGDILYARSGDQIQAAVEQINHVLEKVSRFMDESAPLVEQTLESVNAASNSFTALINRSMEVDLPGQTVIAAEAVASAMTKACCVFDNIIEHQLVERFAGAATGVEDVTNSLAHGKGTLARLINSDSFYLQITATLSKMETVLSDITNYGLLFQYDKKWQRQRVAKMKQMEQLCTAYDFQSYMNREMSDISMSLDRVSKVLAKIECEKAPLDDCCFSENFRELIGRVEHLLGTLQNYNESLENCK